MGSGHGWLGGVGFAASARRLRARDAWIGWDEKRRGDCLHRVLGLCRLLVRPGLSCRNLASHVLGRVTRVVGDDFERLHGYRPWLLETFVDETEHPGTSVRAANWMRVGETCGRGRQDRTCAASETRKPRQLPRDSRSTGGQSTESPKSPKCTTRARPMWRGAPRPTATGDVPSIVLDR